MSYHGGSCRSRVESRSLLVWSIIGFLIKEVKGEENAKNERNCNIRCWQASLG